MPKTLRLTFPGHNDLTLSGRLEMPDSTPLCFATFSHCFTCTKDMLAAYRISKALALLGIATLRFDFAGLGDSEGYFADTSFTSTIQDLIAAAEFLKRDFTSPSLLIGHSLGGTTALACASQIASVKAVVTIASPSQPQHILHHFGPALQQLEQKSAAHINVAGQDYKINPQFLIDIYQYDMRKTLSNLHKPVLIFKVEHDNLVSSSNASDIETWAAGQTTRVNLEHANHILTNKDDTDLVASRIAEWVSQI